MYIKVTSGAYEKPYSIGQLRRDNPGTSFPKKPTDALLAKWGVYPVQPTPQPDYDPATEKVMQGDPINQSGAWVQTWKVVPMTEEEIAAHLQALQDGAVAAAQKRLDDFASTRGYNSMLSLCTYATSPNPKFSKEGQYGVEVRDATWAKLLEMLEEVKAGTRPMPESFVEIEPELPDMEWPV